MEKETEKVELVKEELLKLNAKFHGKSLLSESFYEQLSKAGFPHDQCMLVLLIPEGSNTFFGQLIRQDGRVTEVDMDLDTAKMSSWKDITSEFHKIYNQNIKNKPWSREVVAYDLFRELLAKEAEAKGAR